MYLTHSFALVLIVNLFNVIHAQRTLDTIYANEHQNVALFFPDPIHKAVTGHRGFVFTYNREKQEPYGLLQAVPGKSGNLLVITANDQIYSFHLAYAKTLPSYNHFITMEKSIGTVRSSPDQEEHCTKALDAAEGLNEKYKPFSSYLWERKPKKIVAKGKGGLRLRLEDWVYKGDAVYLVLGIRNRSGIDFEVDRLEVRWVNGSSKKRAAYQEIQMVPLYRYKYPERVKNGEIKRFVYVLPKFVLTDGEHLQLILREHYGGRVLKLMK